MQSVFQFFLSLLFSYTTSGSSVTLGRQVIKKKESEVSRVSGRPTGWLCECLIASLGGGACPVH